MSKLEKVGIFAAIVPLLLGVLSGVWYAAITFNDLSTSIQSYNKEMIVVRGDLKEKDHEHADLDDRVETLERDSMRYPKLIYVNNNFAAMQSSDGSIIRFALYVEEQ